MAKLNAGKRAALPDSAFAYVDSRGKRRLPIHDEAHVRNALSRFNQVRFEDEAARERAREKLLRAAKKYGIVPIGFMTGQIQLERTHATVRSETEAAPFPDGFVTFLMTDIESSTGLLHRLGDRYAEVLNEVRGIIRGSVSRSNGREIDARADEFFAVFERAVDALDAALAVQHALASHEWPAHSAVRVRIGLHSGQPALTETGYVGLAVHAAARVCSAAHGGQILASGATRDAVESKRAGIRFRNLGRHRLAGLPDPEHLFQIEADGLSPSFPPPRV